MKNKINNHDKYFTNNITTKANYRHESEKEKDIVAKHEPKWKKVLNLSNGKNNDNDDFNNDDFNKDLIRLFPILDNVNENNNEKFKDNKNLKDNNNLDSIETKNSKKKSKKKTSGSDNTSSSISENVSNRKLSQNK